MDMTAKNALDDDHDLIDLRQLIAVIQRRFWALIGTGLLVFVIAVIVTLQATPLYTATSSIALEVRQNQVVDFEAVLSGLPPDSAMVDTEVEVLRSRDLAGDVVDRMNLIAVPEFNAELRDPTFVGGLIDGLKGFLSSLMPAPVQSVTSEAEAQEATRDRVVDALIENISVRRQGLTYIIEVAATSDNPRLARDIANAYSDQYLVAQLDAKYEATQRANEWLDERVGTLREEVRLAEEAVARYRDQEGLLNAEGATLTEQQISDVNAQLALQRAELAEARARLDSVQTQIDRGVGPDTIAEVLQSEVIRDLRRQQADIARRRAELSSRYGARHPQILTVEREEADIEQQIEREISRIVANLDNEVSVAQERVRSLQNSLSGLRTELADNNRSIVRLRELERDAEASRTLFESILNRFRETSEQESLDAADARIVSAATVPLNPSSPNVPLNLALAIVLGGVMGAGVVLLLELLDNGLYKDSDLETKLGLQHIASVPQLKSSVFNGAKDPAGYLVEKPLSGFAEAFRTSRTAIRLAGIDNPVKTVAVTSALPGEGKTTTSICIGRISAMADSKTLVVDCDLRRRQLTHAILPDAEVGLLEVLNGQAQLSEVIVKDPETEMWILPLAKSEFTPRDVFGTGAFKTLLDSLRDHYDLVVMDTAPVLAVSDTIEIASLADAVIYTTRWRKTNVQVARNAVQTLHQARANVIGGLLNHVDLNAQARYGYGNSGYYYSAYRKYYTD